jgi:hypothetical protein
MLLCIVVSAQKNTDTLKTWMQKEETAKSITDTILHITDTVKREVEHDNTVVATAVSLKPYNGKIIRSITTHQLGFGVEIEAATNTILSFGAKMLNALHAKSKDNTIKRNVYLKEGTLFNAYLAADNERFMRTVDFIQDCRIIVDNHSSTADSIDIIVITKDIFAYEPSIGDLSPSAQEIGVINNNTLGSGQKLGIDVLHDTRRSSSWGLEGVYGYNNIASSFINVSVLASNINENIYDRRKDEETFLLQFDKPLESQYKRLAGGLLVAKGRSLNRFPNYYGGDYYRYNYGVADAWVGYNIDAQKYLRNETANLKKFVALRYFQYLFFETPYQINDSVYDQRFNSRLGLLGSITLFKQEYYRTKYVYGFGTTEDIPVGYKISITTGWYKQLSLSRPYLGVDVYRNLLSPKQDIIGLFARAGAFLSEGNLQDVGLIIGGSVFSRLIPWGSTRLRQYARLSLSSIDNRLALNPLRINNDLGLRDFTSDLASGDIRIALRLETFIFLKRKLLGFNLAPFVAGDLIWLGKNTVSTDAKGIFYGIGGGIRVRNENLPFGTYELRMLVNPRKLAGDSPFKLSLAINLKFRYNNSYVSKPDIVEMNSDSNGHLY